MRVLVTGAAGHLGDALMRGLPAHGVEPVGLDLRGGDRVAHRASILDAAALAAAMAGVDAVVHAATLHKPHVGHRSKRDFVAVNVAGTQAVLDAAIAAGVRRLVFTSTTSAFGDALRPAPDDPAVWIDEGVRADPKNIYGATKTAAEDLCRLARRDEGLACVVLRTSRFFPEDDDDAAARSAFSSENAKANEFLNRRVDIEDAVSAHAAALDRAEEIGFGLFVVSATPPFERSDAPTLRRDPAAVLDRRIPEWRAVYRDAGFQMAAGLDRIYDNAAARAALGWRPRYDFGLILSQIASGEPIGSHLSRDVGRRGYHDADPFYG